MKRAWLALVVFVCVLPLVVLVVIGPSPLPPSGPMGAKQVATPPERAVIVASMTRWLALEAGGTATQFYSLTWEGGETAPGSFAPGTALYSGFKGVIVVSHWPFLLAYGGHVSDGPDGGYHVETKLDGLKPSQRTPGSLAPSERAKVLGMIDPLVSSSGLVGLYGAGQVSSWTAIAQDASGTLIAKAPLPASKLGARPGGVEVHFSPEFAPLSASVDTPTDH